MSYPGHYFAASDLEIVEFPITACLRGTSSPFSFPVNAFGKTKLIEAISFIRPAAVTGNIM